MSVDLNCTSLARDARRERTVNMLVAAPALVVVVLAVVLPVLGILWLSFTTADGHVTIDNYRLLVSQGTNIGVILATLKIALLVTALAILFGYPLTYFMVQLSPGLTRVFMVAVMLPYLTSVLVQTYAWIMLLGRRGIVNNALLGLGIIDQPMSMLFNVSATVVGMAHYMLPLFVLPLYASMRAIERNCIWAAASLGARPTVAFWKVFFPLSFPGLLAGAFLIFVTSLAFFIIPAVLGGGHVMMIAQQIASAVSTYDGFGVASALGIMLLLVTAGLLFVAARILRLAGVRA